MPLCVCWFFGTGSSFFGSRGSRSSPNVSPVRASKGRLAECASFLAAAWLVGCGGGYGGMVSEPGALRLSDACLDLEVTPRPFDAGLPRPMPVLGLRIGNRCAHPVAVDLRALEVTADVGGRLAPLRPYDPRGELGAGLLDGRATMEERIAWEPPVTAEHVSRVCVRFGGAPACLDLEG